MEEDSDEEPSYDGGERAWTISWLRSEARIKCYLCFEIIYYLSQLACIRGFFLVSGIPNFEDQIESWLPWIRINTTSTVVLCFSLVHVFYTQHFKQSIVTTSLSFMYLADKIQLNYERLAYRQIK